MAEQPALVPLLLAAARQIGAKVDKAMPELTGDRFNSEVFSEAISGRSLARRGGDLPLKVASARIDDTPVLIGELAGPPIQPAIEAQVRQYRNQAAIARSWLAGEAPNLQLILSWSVAAFADVGWRQLAAAIEADERACRKLVWLVPGQPGEDDARQFLARTFAARPWPTTGHRVRLDAMADYELPPGWEEAIDDPQLDFEALVERLIELEGRPQ